MKIFLSSIELASTSGNFPKKFANYLVEDLHIKMKWNLMSYYYIRTRSGLEYANFIKNNSENILIDSGAHSFQKGVRVDWDEYTKQYAEFIKEFDEPKVLGYFEMDIDNLVGYEKVLELRKVLESVSDKIIPVWHKNRGIEEYYKMCQDYSGKIIAITGFKNEDIKDNQYPIFLQIAHKYNCKVHCLGMTRRKVLDKVPFDYVDSSSWAQMGIRGQVGECKNKVTRQETATRREVINAKNYIYYMGIQAYYYNKWYHISHD